MAWFRRNSAQGSRRTKVARDDAAVLREWVAAHRGVEAYVEPQTSTSPTTMVLVAGDGEFIRRRVGSPQAAADFARSAGIPVYDTNRVGLPQRMRDYAVRAQTRRAQPRLDEPAPSTRSVRERDAIAALATVAGVPAPPESASSEDVRALVRAARAKAHPDRNAGSRSAWDAVEDAVRALGLR